MITHFSYKLILLMISSVSLVFLPVQAFGADVSISPSNLNSTPNSQFTVSININNVSNLFGTAFDLMFDPNVLSFVSAQKGTFLEQGGVATDLLTAVSPPGDLIVGYSRQAVGGTATGVSGNGTLMTLTFRASTIGTSNLTFQNNSLCDPTGVDCVIIPATWTNEAVTITNIVDTTPPAPPAGVMVY